MRIENTVRTTSATARGSAGRVGAGGFFLPGDTAVSQQSSAAPVAATAGIDVLLALQAADDPLQSRRKAVRRGTALLDTLELIKADLLLGQVSEGRLNQLMMLIGQARERQIPGLEGVLDDIELRARVELAKFGRFPGM